MSWRIVVISNRAKLECRMNYLICRGEEEKRIHLSEISTVIVETTAVSITAALIIELAKRKIKLIFCDEKRSPYCDCMPFYNAYNTSGCVKEQASWSDANKKNVWTSVVYNKILNQYIFLNELKLNECELLKSYLSEIELDDVTNREGHAAKVYFNALYGQMFKRGNSDAVNSAMNYGYAIILSAFNREIVSQGYITQLGIFHCSEFNQYNLSCDLMEPYRILVDRVVYSNMNDVFDSEFKHKLISILSCQVIIDNKKEYLQNAIRIYVTSIFNALREGDIAVIKNYEL